MTLLYATFDDGIDQAIKQGIKENKLSKDFTISLESRKVLINRLVNLWEDEKDKKLAEKLTIVLMHAFLRGYNEGKIN